MSNIRQRQQPADEASMQMTARDSTDSEGGGQGDTHRTYRNLRGDWGNIALLTFLYVLQGIPLGLAGAIPMILQNRHITYRQQAIFSFVHWPFSLKLLWAPLVDSIYSRRMGRRKSWLVPTQYLLAVFMLILSFTSDSLFGEEGSQPNVYLITATFFVLCFLAATQDIAVDGWALTMLSRCNVGYASTCNCIGQTAGYFIGFVIFLALDSATFCNQYLRSVPSSKGMVTLSEFMYFWGIVYLITTTAVWILKTEKAPNHSTGDLGCNCSIKQSFVNLLKIIKLPSMRILILLLLTIKIGFATPDAVTGLKLNEKGVPKDKMALLAIPMIPLQIFLPVFISRYTAGPRPLDVLIKVYPYRLVFGLIFPLVVWLTPSMQLSPGEYPYYYYALILICYALHQVTLYSMFVAVMSFFAKISDPIIGGTYMTLLNTLSNLGGNWPATVSLWLVDPLTMKSCFGSLTAFSCDNDDQLKECIKEGGQCETAIDGYYVLCLVSVSFGFLWLLWGHRRITRIQSYHESAWRTL